MEEDGEKDKGGNGRKKHLGKRFSGLLLDYDAQQFARRKSSAHSKKAVIPAVAKSIGVKENGKSMGFFGLLFRGKRTSSPNKETCKSQKHGMSIKVSEPNMNQHLRARSDQAQEIYSRNALWLKNSRHVGSARHSQVHSQFLGSLPEMKNLQDSPIIQEEKEKLSKSCNDMSFGIGHGIFLKEERGVLVEDQHEEYRLDIRLSNEEHQETRKNNAGEAEEFFIEEIFNKSDYISDLESSEFQFAKQFLLDQSPCLDSEKKPTTSNKRVLFWPFTRVLYYEKHLDSEADVPWEWKFNPLNTKSSSASKQLPRSPPKPPPRISPRPIQSDSSHFGKRSPPSLPPRPLSFLAPSNSQGTSSEPLEQQVRSRAKKHSLINPPPSPGYVRWSDMQFKNVNDTFFRIENHGECR